MSAAGRGSWMNAPGKNSQGFTLIEITIVLFLGTLLLGLTTLFFAQTLAAGRLTATARELSATIRQARSLARVSDTRQVLTFDLDGREYGLSGRPAKKVPAQLVLKIVDPYQGEINTGKYQLVVESHRGLEGGTFYLSSKKRTIQIQLDPIVGSVVLR
jgi:prepilin-type N-terminal cleavage/methylation domain-containing protein